MDTSGFLVHARVDAQVLETWIEAGWVLPREDTEAQRFSAIDVARAQLIRDLKEDFGVNDEGITIILDLVDQIHGLRGTLRDILGALDAQPDDLRRTIIAAMRAAVSVKTGKSGGAGTDPFPAPNEPVRDA